MLTKQQFFLFFHLIFYFIYFTNSDKDVTFICLILISFINKFDIKKSFVRSSLSWFIHESHDEVFTVKSDFWTLPTLRVSPNIQKYIYIQVPMNMNELVLLFLFLLQSFQYSHDSVD